jgi:MoaA/NifB/PqqE/SkfB family radical SAM enzyme
MYPGTYDIVDCDVESTARFCADWDAVLMNGNHGDPIYHPRFHELVSAMRQINTNIRIGINTNGSFRSEDWWMRLGTLLSRSGDTINFSIDGMPSNSSIYRVNSDWPSIAAAIKVLRRNFPRLTLRWKWIVFRYNQDQIGEGMRLASQMGFDDFKLVWSDRYMSGHELTPTKTRDQVMAEANQWRK